MAEGVAGSGADLDRGSFNFPPRSVPGKGSCRHRGSWPCQRLLVPSQISTYILCHQAMRGPSVLGLTPCPTPRVAEPITSTEARFTRNPSDGILRADSVCTRAVFSILFFLYDSPSAGTEPSVPLPSRRRNAPGLFSMFLKPRPRRRGETQGERAGSRSEVGRGGGEACPPTSPTPAMGKMSPQGTEAGRGSLPSRKSPLGRGQDPHEDVAAQSIKAEGT